MGVAMKHSRIEVTIAARMLLPEGALPRDAVDLVRMAIHRMDALSESPIPQLDVEKVKVRIIEKREFTTYD